MNEKQPISDATKQSMADITQLTIDQAWNQIRVLRKTVEQIKMVQAFYEQNQMSPSQANHYLGRVTEYAILIHLLSADLSVAYRIYLNAKTGYEVQYAGRQLILIINEGFKQIYHYVWPDKKEGNMVTSKRNDSFWVKDIGGLVRLMLPGLADRYQELTEKLNSYDDPELAAMTPTRNLFVHYDRITSDVVDAIEALDIEVLSQKVMPFMLILQQMTSFCMELVQAVAVTSEQMNVDLHKRESEKLAALREQHKDRADLVQMIDTQKAFIDEFLGMK